MLHRSSLASSLALGLLSVAVFPPRTAEACSPPLNPILQFSSPDFPLDGSVVGRLCSGCSIEGATVFEGTEPVAGTFRTLEENDQIVIWTPDAPLTLGANYRIEPGEANSGAHSADFTAVASSAEPPAATASLSTLDQARDVVSCSVPNEWVNGSCQSNVLSYGEKTFSEALLSLAVSGGSKSQYVYSVTFSESAETGTAAAPELPNFSHTFTGEPAEVCYSVVAHPIAGGDDLDLGGECLSTADLELGLRENDFGDREYVLRNCPEAPEDSEGIVRVSDWCDAFTDEREANDCTGAEGWTLEACEAALAECSEVDEGPVTVGQAGSSNDYDEGSSGGGCSTARKPLGSSWFAPVVALFAASFVLGRRGARVRARR